MCGFPSKVTILLVRELTIGKTILVEKDVVSALCHFVMALAHWSLFALIQVERWDDDMNHSNTIVHILCTVSPRCGTSHQRSN